MRTWFFLLFGILLSLILSSCTTYHEVESRHEIAVEAVEVKPIHITIDINVRVDKALDDYFGELDNLQE